MDKKAPNNVEKIRVSLEWPNTEREVQPKISLQNFKTLQIA